MEEKLNDGGNPDVQAGGVAQGPVLGLGEDAGGFGFVFGVGKGGAGVMGVQAGLMEELEEGFQGVNFAADAFGGVALGIKVGNELFQVEGLDRCGLGNTLLGQIGMQLPQITMIGDRGGRRTAVVFEMGEELL